MYDLIVIGGGTGGLTAARLVTASGKRVALIERDRPGGDCLWHGCVPSKSLIHAAKLYHAALNSQRFGVDVDGARLDYDAVRQHIAEAQQESGRVDSPETIASWGVELITGSAQFTSSHAVSVDGRKLRARNFVIATGSKPTIPPIPGLLEAGFDTNVELLDWPTLPESLAILGGGSIGVEFGQVMARFGVKVAIIERDERLIEHEEPAASEVICRVLSGEGIEVITRAEVARVERTGDRCIISLRTTAGPKTIGSERALVATGRSPGIDGLQLDAAGVRVTSRGIAIDAYLRTSQPHIYAVGDVNGGPQLTHVAEDQARTVAKSILSRDRLLSRKPARWNGRVVPRVTYTDPEVASVGLTEAEAHRTRTGVHTWTVPLAEVDRAITMGATDGFLKVVTARGWQSRIPGLAARVGDEIVGACFVGPNAGDLLMPIVVAMRAHLPIGMVAWNMQAYPTLALGVRQVTGLPFDA